MLPEPFSSTALRANPGSSSRILTNFPRPRPGISFKRRDHSGRPGNRRSWNPLRLRFPRSGWSPFDWRKRSSLLPGAGRESPRSSGSRRFTGGRFLPGFPRTPAERRKTLRNPSCAESRRSHFHALPPPLRPGRRRRFLENPVTLVCERTDFDKYLPTIQVEKAGEFFDVRREDGNLTGEVKLRSLVHRRRLARNRSYVGGGSHAGGKMPPPDPETQPDKDNFPGYCDISSAGHLDAGDDYDSAAYRELYEEPVSGQKKEIFASAFHYPKRGNRIPRPENH